MSMKCITVVFVVMKKLKLNGRVFFFFQILLQNWKNQGEVGFVL